MGAFFWFLGVLFAEKHVDADGIVGTWDQHDTAVLCLNCVLAAKVRKSGSKCTSATAQ